MAERLTELDCYDDYQILEEDLRKAIDKLGKLEDIMEKYDIESFELLEHIIKKGKVINSVIEDFAKEEYDKIKQDRDAWKKACELIGKELDMYATKEDNNCSTADYFYQQAKKEGEN